MHQTPLIVLTPDQLQECLRAIVREELSRLLPELLSHQQTKEEPYLTIEDVSQLLGVSEVTIHKWKKEGKLPFHRLGGRVYFLATEVRSAMKTINCKRIN